MPVFAFLFLIFLLLHSSTTFLFSVGRQKPRQNQPPRAKFLFNAFSTGIPKPTKELNVFTIYKLFISIYSSAAFIIT